MLRMIMEEQKPQQNIEHFPIIRMSSDLEKIKAKIEVTETELVEAKANRDRDMILALQNTLAAQQNRENQLTAGAGNVIHCADSSIGSF